MFRHRATFQSSAHLVKSSIGPPASEVGSSIVANFVWQEILTHRSSPLGVCERLAKISIEAEFLYKTY